MKMKQSGVSAGLNWSSIVDRVAKIPFSGVSAGLVRNLVINSAAKKLNIILTPLAIAGALPVYADCPSVTSIQKNSHDKVVKSDNDSIWSSDINLQGIKTGAVFSKAIATGVLLEDEDGKPVSFQSLSTISCEYTVKATSDMKCESGKNNTCVFTLRPAAVLKVNQCNIYKPDLDPQSPWVLSPDRPAGSYAKLVWYDCKPKNNLVGDCPFTFEMYTSPKPPNVEVGKQVAQSSNSNNT